MVGERGFEPPTLVPNQNIQSTKFLIQLRL